MNEKQLRQLIGRAGAARLSVETSLTIPVTVIDWRRNYGRIDALIMPLAGTGERWLDARRITKKRKKPKERPCRVENWGGRDWYLVREYASRSNAKRALKKLRLTMGYNLRSVDRD